jgi:hypothetical protein
MLTEVSELCMTQEDGGPPTVLGTGSAPGESGVYVLVARFQSGMHISATARRHHVYFPMSEHPRLSERPRFECRIENSCARCIHRLHPALITT